MATKIYLPSSGAAAVSPSTWIFADQINPDTLAAVTTKIASAMTDRTEATGTTNPTTRAMRRYVIGPLAAQTISGTVRGVIQATESNTGANATNAIAVKIIQPDGTDRAVLLAVTASDNAGSPQEFLTTAARRRYWEADETEPVDLTSGDATAGDYLVIELGFRSATGTTRNITLRFGDASATDLVYGDGTPAGDDNPWVEFSGTITFVGGAQSVTMDTLTLASSAPSLTVGKGAVSVVMDVLSLVGSAPNLTVVPGAVSVVMDPLTLAGSAVGLTVVPGAVAVLLDALTLAGSARNLTVSAGAVAVLMDALALSASVVSLTVSAPLGGPVTIVMDTLVLDSTLVSLTVWNVIGILGLRLMPRSLALTLEED